MSGFVTSVCLRFVLILFLEFLEVWIIFLHSAVGVIEKNFERHNKYNSAKSELKM